MNEVNTVLGVVELANKLMPIGVGFILKLRQSDGTETVLNTLAHAKEGANANISEMQAHIDKIRAEQNG